VRHPREASASNRRAPWRRDPQRTADRLLARELQPFLPAAKVRIAQALAARDPQLGRRLFTKAAGTTTDPA